MNQTEHLGLSQWDLTDRIRMDDFNADNKKIDAALADLKKSVGDDLAGSLETINAALAAKGGRLELRSEIKANGSSTSIYSVSIPGFKWDELDCCYLWIRYPEDGEGNTTSGVKLELSPANGRSWESPELPQPGYLVVLLPRHDAAANVTGFIIADRFIPFVCDFAYQNIISFTCRSMYNAKVPQPHVMIMGRR